MVARRQVAGWRAELPGHVLGSEKFGCVRSRSLSPSTTTSYPSVGRCAAHSPLTAYAHIPCLYPRRRALPTRLANALSDAPRRRPHRHSRCQCSRRPHMHQSPPIPPRSRACRAQHAALPVTLPSPVRPLRRCGRIDTSLRRRVFAHVTRPVRDVIFGDGSCVGRRGNRERAFGCCVVEREGQDEGTPGMFSASAEGAIPSVALADARATARRDERERRHSERGVGKRRERASGRWMVGRRGGMRVGRVGERDGQHVGTDLQWDTRHRAHCRWLACKRLRGIARRRLPSCVPFLFDLDMFARRKGDQRRGGVADGGVLTSDLDLVAPGARIDQSPWFELRSSYRELRSFHSG
ncbi:uncharacterized protein SCHCODRAFT_0237970 [Schizophyllum commune H4-8]|uniref:Uncharacterized protein n=1 Tax=Schizophyllum commune (strain H4-8 / FGSC 9210) TaxID=578458 RepID=D8QJ08_SCHCM|nr:uncharacterized protein SCHCODRAFT_0237970 [Schizophyllum commune H4-8]KAI5885763.1 hypothetical protein SCHCODRAFT_0237970 [Schizophyllum commune H4-8]